MKHFSIALVFLFLFISCKEKPKPDSEINFKNGSFTSLLEIAKKENKLIFLDCYTSWCAPCKWMDKNVFTKPEVFSFYNKTFINVKLDMEKGEGPEIGKKYGVQSFPTYLFINHKGEVIHKSGSKMSAERFLDLGQNAINPKKALGTLAKFYEEGKLSVDEKLDYAIALRKSGASKSKKVLDEVMSQVDSTWLKTYSGWKLVQAFTSNEESDLFKLLNKNKSLYKEIAGESAINKVYEKVLKRNIYQSLNTLNSTLFLSQLDSLKKITDNPKDVAILHCEYFLKTKDSKKFIETSNFYVDNVLQNDPETIAFIARSATRDETDIDKDILKQSAYLISKAYQMPQNSYGTVSTYALIQSKMGNKEEAIKAGILAVKMADTISTKVKKIAKKKLEAIQAQFAN
ncbi:thioredoxin family protein [Algibacter miyuki]|uniref:Thioredoxin family protein n=1 Tax=Algibacter miyuki TaxID=1306933 RepID=A0ABV5H5Y0_9FLAO|nr:DUF255 domain-containing protein [Algibacter miyuki]MDN3665784.1 thioredoxin family protein [Algibacter miyuki]